MVLAVIVLAAVYALKGSNQTQTEVIKIGAILPLTGNSAELGESSKNALELALADLKNTEYKYQIIFEDDGNFDSTLAASAISKLANIDKVDAVVTMSSGTGNVVSPIANTNKIIHFACASDPNVAQGQFNFINVTSPSEEVKTLIAELQRRGYKRLGLFNLNQQGVIAMTDELKRQIANTDIKIVTEQKFNIDTTDFRSAILNAQQAKPDIYLINLFSPGLENFAKQLKELKIATPITSVEAFEYTDQMGLFEGDWYVNVADAAPWFASEYKDKFGKDYKICAPNIYDALNLIVTAYEKVGQNMAGKPNASDVVAQLLQIQNYNGALGNVSINQSHIVDSAAVVRMIKNGAPVTIPE